MVCAHEDSGAPAITVAQCKRLGVKRIPYHVIANGCCIAIFVIIVHIESAQPVDITRQTLPVRCADKTQQRAFITDSPDEGVFAQWD